LLGLLGKRFARLTRLVALALSIRGFLTWLCWGSEFGDWGQIMVVSGRKFLNLNMVGGEV